MNHLQQEKRALIRQREQLEVRVAILEDEARQLIVGPILKLQERIDTLIARQQAAEQIASNN